MSLPEEMQVVDLISAKRRMEKQMAQQLQKLVEIFESETGCTPFSIYVNIRPIYTMGFERPRNIVTDVEISLDIL